MGFCSPKQHKMPGRREIPHRERNPAHQDLAGSGQEEQEKRFKARVDDPVRQWKLSPMDIESYGRWYDYSRARDMMFEYTDTK